jgi:hypothetical protein
MSKDIRLTAESFTVHAREKISTGEYENAAYHVTIEGRVGGTTELDDETRAELKARLLAAQKEAQESVQRTAENRIREPGHEDWGVRNGE